MESSIVQIKKEVEDLPEDNPDLVDLEEIRNLKVNNSANNFTNNSFCYENVKTEFNEDNCITPGNHFDTNKTNDEQEDVNYNTKINKQLKRSRSKMKIKCEQCGVSCCDKSAYKLHLMDHTGERMHKRKELQCEICLKFFMKKSNLKLHLNNMHRQMDDNGQYSCAQCGNAYKYRSGLLRHMRHHTGDFKCHICDKSCASISILRIHLRIHTGERPYECKICGQNFISKATLHCHSSIHNSNRKTYKCDLCDKELTSKNGLQIHQTLKHSLGEKKHQCGLCEKSFKLHYKLREHLREHHSESKQIGPQEGDTEQNQHTQLKCHICNKTYVKVSSLRVHLQQHTEEPTDFKCEICDKVFKNKKIMRSHQTQVHSTEKKYQCKVCGEKFRAYYQLRSHRLRHKNNGELVENHDTESNEAPQLAETDRSESVCEICDVDYSAEGLEAHMSSHDVKPFSCECFKVFFSENEYKKHVKNDCEVVRSGLGGTEDFNAQSDVKDNLEIGFEGVKGECNG